MSIFNEVKPLIEWEKDLNVWMLDGDFSEHFNNYNKMDAFNILSVRIVKRGWGLIEKGIYRQYQTDINQLLIDEFKNIYQDQFSSLTNSGERKTLIEWEKELGLWFSDLEYMVHYTYITVKDFMRLLADTRRIDNWNISAEKMYDGLKEWQHFHPLCETRTISCDEKIEEKDVSCKNDNIHNNINISLMRTAKKKKVPSVIFKLDKQVKKNKVDIKDKIKSIFERMYNDIKNKSTSKVVSIINSRKSKNKKKLTNSLIKRAIALALTITTSASAYAFSKLDFSKMDELSDNLFINTVDIANTDNISMANGLFAKIEDENSGIKLDTMEVKKQIISSLTELKNKGDILVTKETDEKNKDEHLNEKDMTLEGDKMTNVQGIIHLGDKITIKPGSSIYATSDYAMEDSNREPLYYSYDKERQVCFIGFVENGNPVYVRTQEKYDECIKKGLLIESVGTEDGFYRDEDVIKVLKKV